MESCCSSVAKSCPTLCNPMDCSTPDSLVLHYFPEFAQTHVHPVSDAIQPSHPLSSPSPPAFKFSSTRVFSNESVLPNRWPKYWSFSFSISPSNSGLISCRIDWLELLAVQGTLESLLLHHSSKASAQLSSQSNSHIHTWPMEKPTIALIRQTFVGKVMSLLFNMLSRLLIAFLSGSKRLLISWLWSPSIVILEPKKIKSVTVPIISPSICHEVMGPDATILVFWMLSFKPAFSLSLSSRGF